MKKILTMLMLVVSLNVMAEVGDTTALPANNVVQIRQEITTTSKGKEKTETFVIYKDATGKRRIAYMSKSDYKKWERAQKYAVCVDYLLIEGKNRMKIAIK